MAADPEHTLPSNWTVDAEGKSNSSPLYLAFVAEMDRMIREGGGQSLDPDWTRSKARLIVSQLAHRYGFDPTTSDPVPSCGARYASECEVGNPAYCCQYGNTLDAKVFRARKAASNA